MAFVCIIDDDALVRKSLGNLLKSAGHTTTAFASGEAFFESEPPVDAACILLDLKMKGMQGLDVQRTLIEKGFSAPVIFMSAHADEESIRRALGQGAIEFLRKPFSSEELLNLIDRATSAGDA